MKALTTARILGMLLLGAAVAIGFVAGRWSARSQPGKFTVMATDAVPDEIARLGLERDQLEQLRPILLRGRERVLHVVDRFTPEMQSAMDSTDMEIRRILSDAQRAAFDSSRLANPPLRRIIRRSP